MYVCMYYVDHSLAAAATRPALQLVDRCRRLVTDTRTDRVAVWCLQVDWSLDVHQVTLTVCESVSENVRSLWRVVRRYGRQIFYSGQPSTQTTRLLAVRRLA